MCSSLKHHCIICQCGQCDHTEQNCPQRCTIPECKGYHRTENHHCFICNKTTIHIEADCPNRCTICRGYHKTENHQKSSSDYNPFPKQKNIGLSALGR